uniref:Uncharacterized protein n=1 Tax=Rhizophagus irregularis (strain DAOM 181602 / DAOM 197198 / MUCL 43194) TaxID=747089 RepID=U9SWU2_RHIID
MNSVRTYFAPTDDVTEATIFHKHIEDNAPKFVLCVYAFTLTYSKRGNNYNKKVINFPGGKAQHPSPLAFCRFKRLYPKISCDYYVTHHHNYVLSNTPQRKKRKTVINENLKKSSLRNKNFISDVPDPIFLYIINEVTLKFLTILI